MHCLRITSSEQTISRLFLLLRASADSVNFSYQQSWKMGTWPEALRDWPKLGIVGFNLTVTNSDAKR